MIYVIYVFTIDPTLSGCELSQDCRVLHWSSVWRLPKISSNFLQHLKSNFSPFNVIFVEHLTKKRKLKVKISCRSVQLWYTKPYRGKGETGVKRRPIVSWDSRAQIERHEHPSIESSSTRRTFAKQGNNIEKMVRFKFQANWNIYILYKYTYTYIYSLVKLISSFVEVGFEHQKMFQFST